MDNRIAQARCRVDEIQQGLQADIVCNATLSGVVGGLQESIDHFD